MFYFASDALEPKLPPSAKFKCVLCMELTPPDFVVIGVFTLENFAQCVDLKSENSFVVLFALVVVDCSQETCTDSHQLGTVWL